MRQRQGKKTKKQKQAKVKKTWQTCISVAGLGQSPKTCNGQNTRQKGISEAWLWHVQTNIKNQVSKSMKIRLDNNCEFMLILCKKTKATKELK